MVDVARAAGNDDDSKGLPTEKNADAESDRRPPEQDRTGEPNEPEDSEQPAKPARKHRSFWKELPILIAVALVLVVLIQTFLMRVFLIPSESMEQTLHGCPGCFGDRILVDRVTYRFGDPEPGDVVVFERPTTWNRSEFQSDRSSNGFVSWLQDVMSTFGLAAPDEDDVVKRVIAVGGQTVEGDDQGRVVVDGKPLAEPYVYWAGGTPDGQQRFERFTVPPGTLWVMGDNRNNSGDSRSQGGGRENGVVPVDNVIGKARFIVLPPSRWRGIGDFHGQAQPMALPVAPGWQAAIPVGIGVLAAWPTLWLGRRTAHGLRTVGRRHLGRGDRRP